MEDKLVDLFKAIYQKSPEMEKIKNDAFNCMKDQKVSGNICPYIKKAIQECLNIAKNEINNVIFNSKFYIFLHRFG